MRIAGYLRVSTLRQAEDGVSIEMQKRIIINHCEMLEIISDESEIKWYIDDGWSAKSLERPAMRSLIGDIKTRQMDLIVAYDMSRVSRDIMDMMSLMRMLDKYGVSLKCLYDNPSFETASERFMTTIKMATHQYERERTSERTRDAIINIAESGRYPFGGMCHYGYTKDDDGRMVLNPEEAPLVLEIFQMACEGYRMREIVRVANIRQDKEIFTMGRIRRIIKNRKYTGTISVYGKDYDDLVPAIITEEMQKQAESNLVTHSQKSDRYIFTHVLICRRCGSTLLCKSAYGKMKKMYLYYFCPTCRKRIRQSDVENELSGLKIEPVTEDYTSRYNALGDIESLLLGRRSRLKEKFMDGVVSLENMEIMLTAIENELSDARRKRSAIQSLDTVRVFSDFENEEQKKAFVEMHIRRIVVDVQEKKVLSIEFKESVLGADKKT